MTQHKDLKRLVRERQAQTGESYMTALRHVRDQRPAATSPILVEELIDLTEAGAAIGLTCRIVIQPSLARRVDTAGVLLQLREVLRATRRDPAFDVMRSLALYGETPPYSPDALSSLAFMARVRAGIGGVSSDGRIVAFAMAGLDQPAMIVFHMWTLPPPFSDRPSKMIITTPGGLLDDLPLLAALRTLP